MRSLTQSWLTHVCEMLPKVTVGAYFPNDTALPVETWPQGSILSPALESSAAAAKQQRTALTREAADHAGITVAYPIDISGQPYGTLAISLDVTREQQKAVNQLISWGVSWLELLLDNRGASTTPHDAKFASLFAGPEDLSTILTTLATMLAQMTNSTRASIGLKTTRTTKNGNSIIVKAISHEAAFDPRLDLVGMIESVMEEASQAGVDISYGTESEEILPAHDSFLRQLNRNRLCSMQVTNNSTLVAVILFEQEGSSLLAQDQIQQVIDGLGPLISLKQQASVGVLARIARTVLQPIQALVGPESLTSKLALVVIIMLAVFLGVVHGDFHVKASARLEGLSQHAVAAPFEGYIIASSARAGDTVAAGQVLGQMDDRDLLLEAQRLKAEKDEFTRQYRQALADLNQSESTILKARIEQADARWSLLQHRLEQVELRSPVAGIVLSGDLSRSQGAPVEKGQLLFEIAPLQSYRIVLLVDESDIQDIRPGQYGEVVLTAHPGQKIPFVIENISSVFDSQETEGVVFKTEGRLEGQPELLRPGMEGNARVNIGRRSWGWILFHDVIDWLQLTSWKLLP